jgi:endonuclease/exonuclease/phosphatase family metal-dependent hydrolase
MPELEITDTPPQDVRDGLAALSADLDALLPPKALDRNLLIATWNIRAFGNVTKKWRSAEDDSPRRDYESVLSIAQIVRRFDVIALQEVRANLRGLRYLMRALGPDWSFLMTDVTKGDAGNGERMAFLFDNRKVKLSGLAAELVIPAEELADPAITPDALDRQFARTPYAVSFLCGGKTFILVTLHVKYGDNAADRIPELKAIATWMDEWARDINTYNHNLIALGDFNIDRQDDPLFQAFVSTGLQVPADLNTVPRTIFDQGDGNKFYDQIAWFTGVAGTPALSLHYLRGGGYDFTAHALPGRNLTRQQLSWCISDHYPLWTEFATQD